MGKRAVCLTGPCHRVLSEDTKAALFRWVCDRSSTSVGRAWFLRCHDVGVRVVFWRQSSSEEMQDVVECLTEEIHEYARSFATSYHCSLSWDEDGADESIRASTSSMASLDARVRRE
jgi:recombinational DNA repair ATPase RecF